MPTDQGRRHPQHHFGGFLGLALHKAKSKSSEHLDLDSHHRELDKRVLSSRDLTSGTGFDNVLAELNQQPKFEETSSLEPVEQLQSKKTKYGIADTVPFSVKYSVSKDIDTTSTMSVAVASSSMQSQLISTNGDPDMLDQALNNIRMKLVS